MIHEVEAGAAKAKQAFEDATDTVADTARDGTDRAWRFARVAMKALPLTSLRMVDMMLDRMGLARKSSPMGGVGLFLGGFVAGSVTTALTTPFTGATLRKRLLRGIKGFTQEAEHTFERAADGAAETGKRVAESGKQAVDNVRKNLDKNVERAADMGHQAVDTAKKGADKAADAGHAAIDNGKSYVNDKVADAHLGNGRRPG